MKARTLISVLLISVIASHFFSKERKLGEQQITEKETQKDTSKESDQQGNEKPESSPRKFSEAEIAILAAGGFVVTASGALLIKLGVDYAKAAKQLKKIREWENLKIQGPKTGFEKEMAQIEEEQRKERNKVIEQRNKETELLKKKFQISPKDARAIGMYARDNDLKLENLTQADIDEIQKKLPKPKESIQREQSGNVKYSALTGKPVDTKRGASILDQIRQEQPKSTADTQDKPDTKTTGKPDTKTPGKTDTNTPRKTDTNPPVKTDTNTAGKTDIKAPGKTDIKTPGKTDMKTQPTPKPAPAPTPPAKTGGTRVWGYGGRGK